MAISKASRAASKAWATRRAQAQKRSDAAVKANKTRRRNAVKANKTRRRNAQ